jgi:hypothetical protein
MWHVIEPFRADLRKFLRIVARRQDQIPVYSVQIYGASPWRFSSREGKTGLAPPFECISGLVGGGFVLKAGLGIFGCAARQGAKFP